MPKFKLTVTQALKVFREATIEVEADSLEEAIEKQQESDAPDGPWRETSSSLEDEGVRAA